MSITGHVIIHKPVSVSRETERCIWEGQAHISWSRILCSIFYLNGVIKYCSKYGCSFSTILHVGRFWMSFHGFKHFVNYCVSEMLIKNKEKNWLCTWYWKYLEFRVRSLEFHFWLHYLLYVLDFLILIVLFACFFFCLFE